MALGESQQWGKTGVPYELLSLKTCIEIYSNCMFGKYLFPKIFV